jgi:PPOX class probable F420-dependent enzyme
MKVTEHEPLPDRVEQFLRAPRPAVIGTLRPDGSPSTVATWYLWLGDNRLLLSMDEGGFRARCVARDRRIALTVIGDDWYDHVSVRGKVVELRDDPDWADLDALSQHYRGVPYPRDADFSPLSAVVQVEGWHEFRSTTRT